MKLAMFVTFVLVIALMFTTADMVLHHQRVSMILVLTIVTCVMALVLLALFATVP